MGVRWHEQARTKRIPPAPTPLQRALLGRPTTWFFVPQPSASLRRAGLLLLFVLLLPLPFTAQAQERPQFGVALGLNLATLDAAVETSPRQLAAGGVVVRMGVAGPFAVQSELLFNQKGATLEANGDAIRYGVGYVDLPLMLRVDGPTLGPVALYGLAGGFGGVKVFERQRGAGDFSLPLPDSGTDFFERTNAGATGGLGGTISLRGGRTLTLVVRYTHGLVDVARSLDEQPFAVPFPAEAETRTVSIQIHVGL